MVIEPPSLHTHPLCRSVMELVSVIQKHPSIIREITQPDDRWVRTAEVSCEAAHMAFKEL